MAVEKLNVCARDGRIVLTLGSLEVALDDEGADRFCMGVVQARAAASRQRAEKYTPPITPSDKPADSPA